MPIVYRVVHSDPPLERDFTSNAALGVPLRQPHTARRRDLWAGISVYDTIEGARQIAVDFPQHGSYVAELDLSSGEYRLEKTFGPGHWTLWGEPTTLLDRVARVVRLFS